MRSFSVLICLSALFSTVLAVQHKSSRSDVFDTLADIMEDSLPTNFLEDFSISNLAAKVPFLQQQQQQQQQYPGSTTSGGPVQYFQNLTPLGLGQFLTGIFASTPSPTPGRPGVSTQYPVYPSNENTNLMSALTSIAKYDDLKCVPRLLCEMAAGGRPGEQQRGLGRNTVLSLLSLIGGEMTSPVVVFGRAMLLGLTVQGDPGTCYSAYPSCPRDPNRLVDYLNNHRGGLFRFFSATGLPAYYTQQYSQARIQTPYQRLTTPQINLRPPKVTINSDKGHRHLLPESKVLTHKILPSRPSSELQRPLKFPGDRGRLYSVQQGEAPILEDIPRREQHFAFPDRARTENPREEASTEAYPSPINPNIHRLPPPVAVQLPDRTGTGELRIDNDESTFGPSPFPSRYRRDVRGSNSPSTLKQRMVFPLNEEHRNKVAQNMRFPSDAHKKSINFPSNPESTSNGYRKFNGFNVAAASNEQPVWDKSRDDVTRELVNFPKYTNERENRFEPKRHLMKFPSDNNHDNDAAKVSFNFETPKNERSTRRMKFPVEYADQSEQVVSDHITTTNSVSKVKFQNNQGNFRETSSNGMIFPDTGSNEASNVAKTSFNLESSKNKSTRRMKFPSEYYDQSEKPVSNHIITTNSVSKVKFQNNQETFRETSSYGMIFPDAASKESSNAAKTSFNFETSKNRNSRRMKFPLEYSDQSEKLESSHALTKDHNDISKLRFQNVQKVFGENSSYQITFPYNKVKDSSNVVRFLEKHNEIREN